MTFTPFNLNDNATRNFIRDFVSNNTKTSVVTDEYFPHGDTPHENYPFYEVDFTLNDISFVLQVNSNEVTSAVTDELHYLNGLDFHLPFVNDTLNYNRSLEVALDLLFETLNNVFIAD